MSRLPPECHVLSRVESLLRPANPNEKVPASLRSLGAVRKFDIVCIAKSMHITTPIYSNGGDVLIFADSVDLQASIDTRIARPERLEDHFVDAERQNDDMRMPGAYNSLKLMRSSRKPEIAKLVKSYESYYACPDCLADNDGSLHTFQRPTGITPAVFNWAIGPNEKSNWKWVKHDGLPPPDDWIDEASYRPGRVLIFAGKIERGPSNPRIIAAGNDGAAGGAGEPPNCIGPKTDSTPILWGNMLRPGTSVTDGMRSGCPWRISVFPPSLNAPGGRGGDGASVELVLFGNSAPPSKDLVFNSGGKAGPSAKLQSVSNDYVTLKPRGDITDFVQKPDSWPESSAGAPGRVSLVKASPSDAVVEFVRELRDLDAFRSYDLKELWERADQDLAISSLTFGDYSERVAARMYGNANGAVAAEAHQLILGVPSPASQNLEDGSPPAFICGTVGLKDQMPLGNLSPLFLRARPACGEPGVLFAHFLESSGGLLTIQNPNPVPSAKLDQIVADARQISVDLAKLQTSVDRMERSLQDIYTTVERDRMENEIQSVRSAISALDAAIAAEPKGFMKVAAGVATIASLGGHAFGLGSAIGAIGDPFTVAAGQPSLTPEQIQKIKVDRGHAVGSEGKALWSDISALRSVLRGFKDSGAKAQRAQLQVQLVQLESNLDRFISTQLQVREKTLVREAASLRYELNARASHERAVLALIPHFEDMLKTSVVSYVLASGRNPDPLSANLQTLERMMDDPELGPFVVSPNQALPMCLHGASVPCISVATTTGARVMYDLDRSNATPLPIQLYYIDPTASNRALESFGITRVRIEQVAPAAGNVPPAPTFQ